MTRYHLDFIPRRSWEPGVEPADQRWTRTPNVFTGTEAEATLECSDLETAYDRQVVFRAVPLPPTPEEEARHYCPGCGGDYRERSGEFACWCSIGLARAERILVGEEKAS